MVEDFKRPEATLCLAPEEDVRCGSQVVAERQILIDDLDAVSTRIGRAGKVYFSAFEGIAPRSRLEVASDSFYECSFSCAVITHEAEDFASVDVD